MCACVGVHVWVCMSVWWRAADRERGERERQFVCALKKERGKEITRNQGIEDQAPKACAMKRKKMKHF